VSQRSLEFVPLKISYPRDFDDSVRDDPYERWDRAKVPGGWIVRHRQMQGAIRGAVGENVQVAYHCIACSITFVADIGHNWDGTSLP